jgi:hypothetical protein
MAGRRVKTQEGENLTDENKKKVLALLEAEKPITKKVACEMLNITYNTTRLNKIMEEFKGDLEFRKQMRKKMRTMPMDNPTASQIVSEYLSGESLANISASTYRSITVIKRVLNKYNVPIRNTSVDYFHPVFIDNDEAIKDNYVNGDLVYSARYDCPVTILDSKDTTKYGMTYKIQLHGTRRKTAWQPFYELADLRKVQNELNIKMSDLDEQECKHLIAQALINQKKQEDKRK